jgi:predicted transcriptional regulator
MRRKNPTSIRLSPEAERLIELLAKKLGVSKASVMEMAVRKFAELERIEVKVE